jgi:hypothetical protein
MLKSDRNPSDWIRSRIFVRVAGVLLLGMAAPALPCRADTHVYAGALGTNQNDKLYFSNGALMDATGTNFALPQVLRTNGFNAGYYRGDALTFSALAGTPVNGGPIPGHAAFGSRLAVQLTRVQGPPGGSFAFWEGDGESDLGNITFSVPVGATNSTNCFVISENNGEPGADPYGHIHGREFTASAPGIYLVGFRVIDLSTNGAGGGPIQSPSDELLLRFQAGTRIETIQAFSNRVTLSFRSPPGISNAVQATDAVGSGAWIPIASPLRGNNLPQTITDTNAPASGRYYRLRQLNNLP